MSITRYTVTLGATALLALIPVVGSATTVPNFVVPGIPAPGFPNFDDSVAIKLTKLNTSTWRITADQTAVGPFTFNYDSSQSFTVTNGTYHVQADFNTGTNPQYIAGTGSVSINGTVSGWNVPNWTPPSGVQNLFSANFNGWGNDLTSDSTPVTLGFKTDHTSFQGWAAQFSSGADESVYLYSFNVPSLFMIMTNPKLPVGFNLTYQGRALTTVPLPTAALLFGSVLGLAPWARRKKSTHS